jgi:hypothetical protein
MGGSGSGRWYRRKGRKSTVEESLTIAIRDFHGRLCPGAAGRITWTWAGGNQSSIGYFVTWNGGEPTVTLHYRWQDREEVRIPIRLQTTPVRFGGQRWWFTCPLILDGIACNGRAGQLYLPSGAWYFGCRKCHGLTYRSCQEAHQTERLFGRLGMDLGFDADIGRLLTQGVGGNRVE